MLIKAKTTIGPGIAIILAEGDDLLVGRDVALISTDDEPAVLVREGQHSLRIAGLVRAGDSPAITGLLDDGDDRVACTVEKTGVLVSDGTAVFVVDAVVNLTNRGLISAGGAGIHLSGAEAASRITNTGTILSGGNGIISNGRGLTFVNSGQVTAPNGLAFLSVLEVRDVVINSGVITGAILLGGGDDLYDGRGGRVLRPDGGPAVVFGQGGDDRYIPGVAVETFFDDATGLDTLDFRQTGAVRVALDGGFTNAGAARGDGYTGMDVLLGSLRGNDVLRGAQFAETLAGNGGNDRLLGMAGFDVLTGGAGRDVLSGGADADLFRFNAPGEGGDRITDFETAPIDEFITVSRAGFGGLGAGVLQAGAFRMAATNAAGDGDDRFIFRTGDTTLWFDRDGTGDRFRPVLIADLQAGVALTHADIFAL